MIQETQIERREFTLVQAIYSNDGEPFEVQKFLVGTPSLPAARDRAAAYIARETGKSLPARTPANVYYYPRTYVKQARALAAKGRVDWL